MNKMCVDKLEGAMIYNLKRLSVMSIAFLIIMLIALSAYPYPLLRWGVLFVIVIAVLFNIKKIMLLIKGSMSE